MDLSSVTGMLLKWVINPLMWLLILLGVSIVLFGFLWIRKKRKLVYPTLELVDYGKGKFGFNKIKSGWFGENSYLGGLWTTGKEKVKTQYGDIIEEFSTEDFQEIDGERGIVCFRDPLNPRILFPINKCKIANSELINEIAPASYRDAAVDIFNETIKETGDWREKIAQWLVLGGIIIFALVAIIIITQMVKNGQKEAADLIVKAGDICLSNAKEVCGEVCSRLPSTAP